MQLKQMAEWLRMVTLVALMMPSSYSALLANDGAINIDAGGLVFETNKDIKILEENLYISEQRIDVRYIFKNISDHPISLKIGFPLPDILANDMVDRAPEPNNRGYYVDFLTVAGGESIDAAEVIDVVDLNGKLITPLFKKEGFSVQPQAAFYQKEFFDPHNKAAIQIKDRMRKLGLLGNFESMKWKFRIVYTWEYTFLPGEETHVLHSYKPLRGGFIFTPKLEHPGADKDFAEWFREKFCTDDQTWRTMLEIEKEKPTLTVSEIGYVLMTGANWAGSIERFKMTFDKGTSNNVVSFCGFKRLEPVNATEYAFEAQNFIPREDFRVAILGQ